jgi:hypothetical protein
MKFGCKHYEEPCNQMMVAYEKINKVNASIFYEVALFFFDKNSNFFL